MQVELIVEKCCPNIESARKQLLLAFQEIKKTPEWKEWEISGSDVPDRVRGYGSPTILINGKDVCGEQSSGNDDCCRVYTNPEGGYIGTPSLTDIVEALKKG